jgi:signal transduction histidine kinase
MNRHAGRYCQLAWIGMLGQACAAAETNWDERLARTFSERIRQVETELAEAKSKLAPLPGVPIDDQGGTGGFAGIHTSAIPAAGKPHAVEVRWNQESPVDLIALIPARRYNAKGLNAQYGLPGAFTVELFGPSGECVSRVSVERDVRGNPVRKGHPFVYRISPPVQASGLRVLADELRPDPDEEEGFVHAWAEAFVFDGEKNVAAGADVRCLGGGNDARSAWHWSNAFLVDGQTPLGLPEIPAGDHGNIGWMSEQHERADHPSALTIDLGRSTTVEGIRLFPAKPPISDLPSGFGFPRKLNVSVADSMDPGATWSPISVVDLRNPGMNPVRIPCEPRPGRYLKIEATMLWKEFEFYPAFFALSEVEVISDGKNLALGKPVRSSDGMNNLIAPGGKFWSGAALSDGFGPDGKLVSTREWLLQLDARLALETRIHNLREEETRVINGWRRAGIWTSVLMGLAGAFAIIALPIRYRIRSNKELLKVRERIAGDLHDEVGSNLGSIQMFADLAEGRSGPSDELKRIQRIAAETVSAVRDIVWLLRPGGEHRIGTVEHLRETGSIMLESLDWRFHANEEAWNVELPEDETRHLFLFYREALHNIMRHAKATKVEINVNRLDGRFEIDIADDGLGIATERMERPSTLRALRQRASALDAELKVDTKPGEGTRLTLIIPITRKRAKKLRETTTPAE